MFYDEDFDNLTNAQAELAILIAEDEEEIAWSDQREIRGN